MGNQKLSTFGAASLITVAILLVTINPTVACSTGGIGGGGACKQCIRNQLKKGCPSCGPILQCMALCLWRGVSKAKCIKKCDCDGAMLTLSDCKTCMSTCKCNCVAYNI